MKGFENFEESPGSLLSSNPDTPDISEVEGTYASPGSCGILPTGIIYYSSWKNKADGMAIHAQETLQAIASANLPVRAESSVQGMYLDEDMPENIGHLRYLEEVTMRSTCVTIKHIVFNSHDYLHNQLIPAGAHFSSLDESSKAGGEVSLAEKVSKNTIIYTSWERDTVRKDLVDLLNIALEVWVPCEKNKEVFEEAGVKRVRVIPFSFDPNNYPVYPRSRKVQKIVEGALSTYYKSSTSEVPNGKLFYHIGKWEPRKNQHRMLGAFLQAFTPKSKASFLIKTSPYGGIWGNYPSPEESVEYWLNHKAVKANGWDEESLGKFVRIIDKKISLEDLQDIHKNRNIYVSAAHAEAWDIPAFEARIFGNRLVYSGWGHDEYASSGDVKIEEEPRMCPVDPGYMWEKEAGWMDIPLNSIKRAMQKAEPLKEKVFPSDLLRFSRVEVGQKIKEALVEHYPQLKSVRGFG